MTSPTFKTCKRYNIPRHAHFITFSCFRRQPFLSKDRPRIWLIDALNTTLTKFDLSLLAWVIMPEHVHLLFYPRKPIYQISDILSAIKLPITRKAVAYTKKHAPHFLPHMLDLQPNQKSAHRFWQRGGGYDRNIFTTTELVEKINYIHLNPVRRALCSHPTDWPWSSAKNHARLCTTPLPIDLPLLQDWLA